ncbi:Gfo/Idh/MocA family oxidoreductase [Cyanobacterium stanieri LEGE 03274]|uniref:Gfo/Idh/MocA family oxidoreductase n=1 Tax=Cyanobacterium stanieri LEGE 03274 TaxID=1828756 RepID=A0ABR9V316_9CHRO|nr:Gfo/Idh/MocA family oxidoreductase [Cyanobacterium stanieri]MBE9222263.1 Gfo/Idh/MocA family oxidoreductase [Cyanobacterium stanieri LEGE 03274]
MINIAILGAGRWGSHFVKIFLNHRNVNLMAICDSSPERLYFIKEKYQVSNSVDLLTDWQTISNIKDLDAVIITTPASSHYVLIKHFLTQGYHILAEKPITIKSNEAKELTELANENNLILFVDHTYLFNPLIEQLSRKIQTEDIGNLKYGYASRTHADAIRGDVNVIWDLAIHDISIFNYVLREKPFQVCAQGQNFLSHDSIDVAWLKLFYPSGFVATIHVSWLNADKQRKLTLVGEKGSFVFDEMMPQSPLTLHRANIHQDMSPMIVDGYATENVDFTPFNTLQLMGDRFLSTIKTNHQPTISTGEFATELIQILEAMDISLENNSAMVSVNYG